MQARFSRRDRVLNMRSAREMCYTKTIECWHCVSNCVPYTVTRCVPMVVCTGMSNKTSRGPRTVFQSSVEM